MNGDLGLLGGRTATSHISRQERITDIGGGGCGFGTARRLGILKTELMNFGCWVHSFCSRLGRVRRTRFGSLVVRGRVPGSIDQYAQRVCIAAWLAFDCQVVRAACSLRPNPDGFVVERFGQSAYEHHALRRAGDQTMAERQKQKGHRFWKGAHEFWMAEVTHFA